MIKLKVYGEKEIFENIKKIKRHMPKIVKKALIKGGFSILREAQKNTPVEFGNLKASGYVIWSTSQGSDVKFKDNGNPKQMQELKSGMLAALENAKSEINKENAKETVMVVVGFGAYYAIFVHEDLETSHNVGSAQFLSRAIESKKRDIMKEIKNLMKPYF